MNVLDAAGKKWPAVICRYSDYICLSLLKKTTTSAYILEILDQLFIEFLPKHHQNRRWPTAQIGIRQLLQEQGHLPQVIIAL